MYPLSSIPPFFLRNENHVGIAPAGCFPPYQPPSRQVQPVRGTSYQLQGHGWEKLDYFSPLFCASGILSSYCSNSSWIQLKFTLALVLWQSRALGPNNITHSFLLSFWIMGRSGFFFFFAFGNLGVASSPYLIFQLFLHTYNKFLVLSFASFIYLVVSVSWLDLGHTLFIMHLSNAND